MLKKLTILTFFFFCVIIIAQEPINYTTKEGLPSNHIYDIQEDSNGFMWFATNRGLVKYDGDTFKIFTIKDGLPNNDTWSLDLDYQGKLWYFSKSNYQGYIVNDSIYKFPIEDKKVESPRVFYKSKENFWFNGSRVYALKDSVFKGTSFYSKYTIQQLSDKLIDIKKKYNFLSPITTSITNPETNEIVIILKDKLLFFDIDFNLIKETKQNLPKDIDFNDIQTLGIAYNQIGYFASNKGFLFINFKSKTSNYIDLTKFPNIKNYNFIKFKSLKNEIQVSIPNHLFIYNYDLELIEEHEFTEQKSNIGSYKDSKGNIWLRSMTNGISLKPNTQTQSNYSLKNKKVQKINKIDGDFYAGINNDGFYKLNRATNQYEAYKRFNKANNEIYHIKNETTLKQALFIGGGGSIRLIDKKMKPKVIELIFTSSPDKQYSFKDIIDFNGFTYFTGSSGIYKTIKNKVDGELVSRKQGLTSSSVFKNNLYFAGSDGLHLLKNDIIQKTNITNNISKTSINTMLATKNNLFVGTDGRGVYRYNGNNVIHLKNTDGFSVQKILKKNNKLWLATEKGVRKVSLNLNDLENSLISNSFYETDGLLQNNTNDIYLENDTLFAASDIGLAKLNVDSPIYKQQPKLYFKTKNDTLSYVNGERDNISINFTLQDYNNQENIRYQYRLLPSQKEWIQTDTKILNFANLSPELYTLEVKATDQHNNQSVIKQYLNVIPAWWQTTVAKIGFGILTLLCFLGFVKMLKINIQKKEKEKAQLDKKIAGLELQALRSQMNPHFVHNSLNAIQYYIQRNEVEQSEDYLVKFSKLVREFFEYSRRQSITIAEEVSLLENYLSIEKLRFEDKLSYNIIADDILDTEEQIIPSMILQPLVENAVNHGLFHKKTNGKVNISFKYIDEETFKVTVEDDGIGVKKAKEIYKNSSKNYQSHSSEVLQERLQLLNKSKHWYIDFLIKDLSENNNQTGTLVSILFKQLKL